MDEMVRLIDGVGPGSTSGVVRVRVRACAWGGARDRVGVRMTCGGRRRTYLPPILTLLRRCGCYISTPAVRVRLND